MTDLGREKRALELFEAMLDLDEEERIEWLEHHPVADEAVQRRVRQLAMADRLVSLRTGAAVGSAQTVTPPQRIGAYQIERLIASGGMGSVFLGKRDLGDFEHEVAIKLIKPGLLSQELTSRFLRERQVLAQFSHANIARLYDGGTTKDGQPYIVMERVEGTGLVEWLQAADPDRETRLRMFLKICDAVAHAHRHLVIHRDLTPANILVDRDGEPKLIDFGIAKPESEGFAAGPSCVEPALPDAAFLTLTPGYAAPERLRGDEATTLTDVYSAGRLLNFLLPKPRAPELQAIANRAIARRPQDRYGSIEVLAEDVRRFIDQRTVHAYGSGARYALHKWIVRNRPQAILAGALVLAILCGFAATAWNWQRAETARAQAETRFGEVRSIANTMMFDVYDDVAQVPGSEAARLSLAKTSLGYLDRLAQSEIAPLDVQIEVAQGYIRLSQVTGSTAGGTLGHIAQGRDLAQVGLAKLEALAQQHPDNRDVAFALAKALSYESGEALYAEGDIERAQRLARRSLTLFGDVEPASAAEAATILDAHRRLGETMGWQGETERADAQFRRGIARARQFSTTFTNAPEIRRNLANLFGKAGEAQAMAGDFDRAMTYYAPGMALAEAISRKTGNAPSDLRNLAIYQLAVSKVEAERGNLPAAKRIAVDLLANARALMAGSPDDGNAKAFYVAAALQSAMLRAQAGKRDEARALVMDAMAQSRATIALSGDVSGLKMQHAVRLHEAAQVYLVLANKQQSCALMRESVAYMEEFARSQSLPESTRRGNLEPMRAALMKCSG